MRISVVCILSLALLSCSKPAGEVPAVDGNAIKAHIQKLASDEMEGRAPGGKVRRRLGRDLRAWLAILPAA